MKIADFLPEDAVIPDLRATRKPEAIREFSEHIARQEPSVSADDVFRVLSDRERLGSTALAEDIAIPHGKLDSAHRLLAAFGRSRKGVKFGAEDGSQTHYFFVLIAPARSAGDHLKALARISRLFRDPSLRQRLKGAETAADIYRVIREVDDAGSR